MGRTRTRSLTHKSTMPNVSGSEIYMQITDYEWTTAPSFWYLRPSVCVATRRIVRLHEAIFNEIIFLIMERGEHKRRFSFVV